jgi:WD40 repeat protein
MYDTQTRIWDMQSGMAVTQDPSAEGNLRVKSILSSSDGSFLVKLGLRSDDITSIEVWDTTPPRLTAKLDTLDEDPPVELIALSFDDQYLVSVDRECDIRVYRISDNQLVPLSKHTPHCDWQIEAVAFCDAWTIRLLHLEWWTHSIQCATMDLHTGFCSIVPLRNPASFRSVEITCTAISRNGNRVAIGFKGGHVQLYHAADGRAVGKSALEHHGGRPDKPAITAVAFSVTSDCLFTTDAAGYCWLWHVPSARAVIAFAADGGVEHQDVTVLSRFREMVATWRREHQRRRDSESTLAPDSLDTDTNM